LINVLQIKVNSLNKLIIHKKAFVFCVLQQIVLEKNARAHNEKYINWKTICEREG